MQARKTGDAITTLHNKPLGLAMGVLIAAHLLILIVFGDSSKIGAISDFLTLGAAMLTCAACFAAVSRSQAVARGFWKLTGATFAMWSLGKAILMYDFYVRGMVTVPIVPLLIFFLSAAPMFVAIFISAEDHKRGINWEGILDAIQILVLILIVYLFVIYIPLLIKGEQTVGPLEDRLLLGRNVLLAVGLLARALLSRSRYVRQLYLPVAIVMGVFAYVTWVGNQAQTASDAPNTAWYDLAWSIPFCLIGLRATLWKQPPEVQGDQRGPENMGAVVFAYLPSLILPAMLLVKMHDIVMEQIVLGLVGLMLSIVLFTARLALTQRRQRLTMEALSASERQYESLFERNMAGVYRSTMTGALLNCNPAFASMFGYTREELLVLSMNALYFGGAEERKRRIEEFRNGAAPAPREGCFRRKDGSQLWALQNALVEKLADGSEIYEGTLVDITERKLTSVAIEDWKRRYDAAVLASGQIIYDWDPISKRTTFGGAVDEILGYTPEELAAGSDGWRALVHPEDSTKYLETMRQGSENLQAFDFEYRVRRKDGSYRTVREQGRVVVENGGTSKHMVGFITDITERRVLEAQLRQAQKMEALGRLAGGVAHDFNNLLTIISGYSDIQASRTLPSDPVHQEAQQIKSAADRAAALTRQLLAFSRQQVLQPRRVNLNDIIRNAEKMLVRLIGEDVEVRTALSPNLGTVKVDPGQMDQVLMNLVINARDAMPNGGKLTIQTENVELDETYVRNHVYTVPGRYVLLAVSDNGVGMDPKTQALMFEPFFTTKDPGKGTGLGMPTVYGIVKQSEGYIEVYSELNHGTTLKIYLPRVDAAVENVPLAGTPAAAIQGARGSERVLLVEDDVQLRRLVASVLIGRGYQVEIVEKLEQLEETIRRVVKCDLLLTDVVMPKMNGPEVAKRVAQHWDGIKVLYVSGYTTNAIVHHGVLEQGLHFLQKPFTPTALAEKVRAVLDDSVARSAPRPS